MAAALGRSGRRCLGRVCAEWLGDIVAVVGTCFSVSSVICPDSWRAFVSDGERKSAEREESGAFTAEGEWFRVGTPASGKV